MRAVRWFGLGAGALLCARVIVGCASDTTTEPFDAGALPDVVTGGHDAAHDAITADGAPPVGHDAAGDDGSIAPGDDGSTGDDAGDASHAVDAGDAGSHADASDGATPIDASDAASGDDASDAASGEDASDATTEDAGDAGETDAGSVVCLGYDAGTNPITNVVATAGGNVVGNNGTVPAADPVTLTATTAPDGLATNLQIGYCLGTGTCNAVYVVMAPAADAGAGTQVWTGDVPAQTAGTHVAWWVQSQDTCGTGQTHYWSNFGNNFHYTTQ